MEICNIWNLVELFKLNWHFVNWVELRETFGMKWNFWISLVEKEPMGRSFSQSVGTSLDSNAKPCHLSKCYFMEFQRCCIILCSVLYTTHYHIKQVFPRVPTFNAFLILHHNLFGFGSIEYCQTIIIFCWNCQGDRIYCLASIIAVSQSEKVVILFGAVGFWVRIKFW